MAAPRLEYTKFPKPTPVERLCDGSFRFLFTEIREQTGLNRWRARMAFGRPYPPAPWCPRPWSKTKIVTMTKSEARLAGKTVTRVIVDEHLSAEQVRALNRVIKPVKGKPGKKG